MNKVPKLTEELKVKILKFLKDNHVEVTWDNNERINDKQLKRLCNSKSLEELESSIDQITDDLFELNIDYTSDLENGLRDECLKHFEINDEDTEDMNYLDIEEFIFDNLTVNFNVDDLIKQTNIELKIQVNSNYDCTNSNYYNCLDGYSYKDSYFGSMIDFFNINPKTIKDRMLKHETPTQGDYPNLTERDGNEKIRIGTFLREFYENPSTCNWVFITKVNLTKFIELKEQTFEKYSKKILSLGLDTTNGLFDCSSGSGSLLEGELLKTDFNLHYGETEYNDLSMEIMLQSSNAYSYTVTDVYGDALSKESEINII